MAIAPRSNSFNVRTVPDDIWKVAAENIQGTKFWLGTHAPAPSGIVGLKPQEMYEVAIALACMDVCVTVDTGPMHIAAALGTPVVVIEQSSSPIVHLSDQRDWSSIRPPLDCLNCQVHRCPINSAKPPCQNVSPYQIALAVNQKLRGRYSEDVSAIIAVWRPTADRLNRCLSQIIPQVDEIFVARDQFGIWPEGRMNHPKVTYLDSPRHDIGYGRKMNFCARHSNGKYLLLINDDVYANPCAVEKMSELMTDDVGIVGHLMRYPNGTIQHGGTFREKARIRFEHFDRGQMNKTIKEPREMESVTGCCVLVRRKVFFDVLGHDERFHLSYDDNDLCMKARQQGWKVMYNPLVESIHEEGPSMKATKGITQHVLDSRDVFESKWGWYWKKNDGKEIGTFK